ncbi:hypothetical protein J2T17_004783 [Paenibacillus mucilaginosus]|uniref:hypothetical protein n=1 Tax=Paenibacillus mucilaginosus TaxID=61624 RepID=UPI003D258A1E
MTLAGKTLGLLAIFIIFRTLLAWTIRFLDKRCRLRPSTLHFILAAAGTVPLVHLVQSAVQGRAAMSLTVMPALLILYTVIKGLWVRKQEESAL